MLRWFSSRRKILKMSPLRSDEKHSLLNIARRAIESALRQGSPAELPVLAGNLGVPGGAFVTLRRRGRLRGCIGRVAASEPLARVVAECAAAAATADPRFPHLERSDLHELQIEVSVLSCPQRAMPEEVQPGIHGLVISRCEGLPEERRGVLLPQVAAEHRWSTERFLEETCRKAGLAADAWKRPDTRIEIFTAQVFSEADLAASSNDGDAANPDAYSSSQ